METGNNLEIYERDYLLSCHYGDYKRALELAQKLYDMKIYWLGKKHPDILKLLRDLAYLNNKLGQHEKALEIKEEIFNWLSSVKGQEHPETLQALSDLVNSYEKFGKIDNPKTKDALKLLNEIKKKLQE
ncbi:MAG: tetratricopeptide repeat protein [Ruminococcaceae bacterium]|nr:tetratricopeptide repeat protein [Oscillospiraceae bacterium]